MLLNTNSSQQIGQPRVAAQWIIFRLDFHPGNIPGALLKSSLKPGKHLVSVAENYVNVSYQGGVNILVRQSLLELLDNFFGLGAVAESCFARSNLRQNKR